MTLLVLSVGLLLSGGVAALLTQRHPRASTAVAALSVVASALCGLPPVARALLGTPHPDLRLAWAVPGGEIVLGLDPLASFFLAPLLVLAAAAAVYGRAYMLAHAGMRNLGAPSLFFNLTVASMVLVILARHALLFLVSWELMSLASYLLVTFDHDKPEVRRAGWIYLIASHLGLACLTGLFLLLGRSSEGLTFSAFAASRIATGAGGILAFWLAMVGFGIKAGFVPLHVWLPEAHAAAPSHVSALMSGMLIKLGLYGFLRTLTFLQPAPWWGPVFIVVGLSGAALGISLALYQRDLKRSLAYSSIENIGIVALGLGVGFLGSHRGDLRVAALGACGGLFHLWNHVLMKGLMFLSAGSLLHGSGSKDLEKLGGLLKRMPWTGTLMILGAVAISGLPPLNAFASEWLIYLGLLKGATTVKGVGGLLLLLAVGGLALVGALAALCFTRLCGIALLGEPRAAGARQAQESPGWMLAPMAVLAAAIVLVSVAPGSVVSLFGSVLAEILPSRLARDPGLDLQAAVGDLGTLGTMSRVVWVALASAALLFLLLLRRMPRAVDETWGCGYVAPSPRMQYTARSFSQLVSQNLLPRRLRARIQSEPPTGLLPGPARLSADCTDPITRGLYEPFLDRLARRFARLRWLQQGILHVYLLYILVVVILALAWLSVREATWFGSGPWPRR